VKDPFAYDQSRPLNVQAQKAVPVGPVNVRSLSYETGDGSRVPALFAIPRRGKVLGCLMYQPGVGQAKEVAAPLWPGTAKLGLAMFTIDTRATGARANGSPTISQILGSPDLIVSFLREDVVDLRRGLDYLYGQRICHRNVGYLGVSEGAILGALLSGGDRRIRTAVLASVGATWRARIFYSPLILPGIVNNPDVFRAGVNELSPFDPARWVAKISPRPVMIVDGLSDPSIPPIDALDLAAAAGAPKRLLLHRGGHDPFSGPGSRSTVSKIAAFLSTHLAHRSGR
jgi:hypothetical protein